MNINLACKMYPEELSPKYLNNPKLKAEVDFYYTLSKQLPAGYTVFYDIAWLAPVNGVNPQDGQTDFVIAHPQKGILLIEVKGGNISFNADKRQWYSKGRDGKFEIDPIEQVKKSKKALQDKLQCVPTLKKAWINIYHAVAFPQAPVPKEFDLFEATRDILIDAGDMQYLSEKIEAIYQYYNPKKKPWSDGCSVIRELCNILGRSYDFRMPLAEKSEAECDQIWRLTEDQFDLLDSLNKIRRVTVRGCAGSGKTCLAVEKARRLSQEGSRTLLTCFNRPLGEHLRTLLPENGLLTINHFHGLCIASAKKIGIELPPYQKDHDNRELEKQYIEALKQSMRMKPELRFDAIIVDEGQDFGKSWWGALEECLSSPQSIFYIFFDDNQLLYSDRGCLPQGMIEYSLNQNIRNSQTIFEQVRRFYKNSDGMKMKCKGPEGRPVEQHVYTTDEGMRKDVIKTIQRLVEEERFAANDLVVLTPKSLGRSALMKCDEDSQYELVSKETGSKNQVLCSTIHSFKGLERKCVLVAELDDEMLKRTKDERANRLYVGFSRAKCHLEIFATSPVLKQIQLERAH